jgi:hypothetical protein
MTESSYRLFYFNCKRHVRSILSCRSSHLPLRYTRFVAVRAAMSSIIRALSWSLVKRSSVAPYPQFLNSPPMVFRHHPPRHHINCYMNSQILLFQLGRVVPRDVFSTAGRMRNHPDCCRQTYSRRDVMPRFITRDERGKKEGGWPPSGCTLQ